ncbi:MAG: prolipoprotein diacylglyceryl transferase, partial [Desulfovibrio sp.]|nr:prolipoprotein diacylglyceryl transferase [Desulfovibrio sp.]
MIHDFSPVAFSLGQFEVRWYGLMYLIGFVLGWFLGRFRAKRLYPDWGRHDVDDLLTICM